ncbi:MAG TPA: type II secretion system F family protein [Candidatus Saccharimonadales bacterium]
MTEAKAPKTRKYHISSKYRDYFTNNIALLLRAAVPVQEAFASLKETSKSTELNKALDQMQRDVDEGLPLWQVMERSGVATQQTLTLVRLGEQSGRLVENLQIAARQEEKQRVFRSKVRSAMLYPSFVLGLSLLVGLGVAWFLLPRLAETFKQLNVQLPFISKVFIEFGVFLKANGYWAVPLFLAAVALIIYVLFVHPKTRGIGQRFLFHIPGVSRLMHEVEIARFGYLMGTLLQAGLTVTQSLQSLADATNAPQYKKLYIMLKDAFEDGYSFRSTLPKEPANAKQLPPPVQQMVIAGERSGSLPETLLSIGTIYEEKSDLSTQSLATILEPLLLLVVWVGVMGVAIAVIMPIYSLVGGLQ